MSYKKRFDANKVNLLEQGGFPYIVRMGSNNGQKGFINGEEKYLNEGNTISFGQDTATMYYQENPYFTGDKIKILRAKDNRFGKNNAFFFIAMMNRAFSSFSWGASSFSVKVIGEQKIFLPVKNKDIHFEFMESFIAELEAERIAELEAYLLAAGLKDYNLTPEEQGVIEKIKSSKESHLKWFKITDLFNVKNSRNILARDIIPNSGDTPYLCASAENNAVSSYISYDKSFLDEGNCVFIGGKTFVVTYQEKSFYSNDSHNLILHLKEDDKRNKLVQLYLASSIYKCLNHKYSWGDSISNRKIQGDEVLLPVIDGKPDYQLMETLISAVQKMVIKGVVNYADKKLTIADHTIQQSST